MSELMTVRQVSRRLRVSQTTVYRLMADGKLNPLNLRERSIRFTEEEIARFLKASEGVRQ